MTGDWHFLRAVASALLLALLLSGLGGCSMLGLGYGQLDTFAAWTANDYFEMAPDQRQEFSRRFDRLHDWHRYEQLPDYVAFLTATRVKLHDGIKRDDVLWVIEGLKTRYRTVVTRGADDAAAMLMTVTEPPLGQSNHEHDDSSAKDDAQRTPRKRRSSRR